MQECHQPRALPPGAQDIQPLNPTDHQAPTLLERAPCPWLFGQPSLSKSSHPSINLPALEHIFFFFSCGALLYLCFSVSASGDQEEWISFPFLSFVSICTCSLSVFRLGIRLKHVYNGSGTRNLFLVMTDRPSPPEAEGRGGGWGGKVTDFLKGL